VESGTPELIREIDFVITFIQVSQPPSRNSGSGKRPFWNFGNIPPGFSAPRLGHEGAIALINGKITYAKGFEVNAVDTTGAGDVSMRDLLRTSPELVGDRDPEIRQCRRRRIQMP